MSELARILLVEDDPRDVELTLTALGEYNLANEVSLPATEKKPWITSIVEASSALAPTTTPRSCCST
jgi:hypothetical protein